MIIAPQSYTLKDDHIDATAQIESWKVADDAQMTSSNVVQSAERLTHHMEFAGGGTVDLHAGLMLAQHANDLVLGKSASPHHSSPSDELTYQWHEFWGAGHQGLEQTAPKNG